MSDTRGSLCPALVKDREATRILQLSYTDIYGIT